MNSIRLVVCAGMLLSAEASDILLPFDDVSRPDLIQDISQEAFVLEHDGQISLSSSVKRNGEGSLELDSERASGIRQSLREAPYQRFAGEIRQMTIVCWVYLPASYAGDNFFLAGRTYERRSLAGGRVDDMVGIWRFFVNRRGLWFLGDGKEYVYTARGSVMIEPQQWTHLAMTFDNGKVRFFLNGLLISEREFPDGRTSLPAMVNDGSEGMLNIASNPGYAYSPMPPGTFVDDFGYFGDIALSVEGINAIYESGLKQFSVKSRKE